MRWKEKYESKIVRRDEICYALLGRENNCPLYVVAEFPIHVDQDVLKTYLSFIERTTPDYVQKEIRMSRNVVRIHSKNLTKRETLALLTLGRYVTEKPRVLFALQQNLRLGKNDGNAFVDSHMDNDPNINHSLCPYGQAFSPSPCDCSNLFVEGWKRLRAKNAVGDWNHTYSLDLVSTFYGLS